jgi:GMP reductase
LKDLKYSDVVLRPNYSTLKSRSKAKTSCLLGDKKFKLPVAPANMRAVTNKNKSYWLSENDYFYVMHRFDVDPLEFCEEAKDWKTVSISVGVQPRDWDDIVLLSSHFCRLDYITVDIAHGHSILMKETIKHIKKFLPDTFIIAGNVATSQAVQDLASWGADCVKVGIGQGYVCTTKDKTGFTRPMFSCVLDCAGDSPVPIIADGGIKCNGDIAKALVAGARMVMVGSLFSQCIDSPAISTVLNGAIYKQYFGSASEHNKESKKHIEGVMKEIPSNNMSYEEKLEEIKQDLQSSISYAGGKDLNCLRDVKWDQV